MLSRFSLPPLLLLASTNLAQADCKSDIEALMKGMETAGSYHVDAESNFKGRTTNLTADVILPHSLRWESLGIGMVVTTHGVWTNAGLGLKKTSDERGSEITQFVRANLSSGARAITDAECLGSADFEGNGFTMFNYHLDNRSLGIASTSKVSMYVNSDNRPE